MTLDHAFVLVRPWRAGQTATDAADELAASLEAVGFSGGRHRAHAGQGTENRCFWFEGFMLELLFVVSRDEAAHPRSAPLALPARLDEPGASPFGFASRPSDTGRTGPDYPHVVYRPQYLPPTLGIAVASDTPVSEPLWFHLPFATAEDGAARRGALRNPNGACRVGRVTLAAPEPLGARSAAIAATLGIAVVDGENGHRLNLALEGEALADGALVPHERLPLSFDCRRTGR